MSYFPSPNANKVWAALQQSRSQHSTSPHPTLACSRPEMPNPDTVVDASTQDAEDLHHRWTCEEPRGLALLTLPVSFPNGLPTTTFDTSPTMNMSCAWPEPFPYADNFIDASEPGAPSTWNDDYDAFVPVLPTMDWDNMQASASTAADSSRASPECSDYSASSTFSSTSSPYATSNGIMRTAGSPAVKLEDLADSGPSAFRYKQSTAFFDDCRAINPEELVTKPPSTPFGQAYVTHSLPSTPQFLDVKPVLSQLRPDSYRAYSAEDARVDALASRQKRGFTKPETSTCSCKECGRLFQRSYNLKAHMVTHNPNREQPHACQYGGCSQRFARKTDLNRHENSVHLKIRNYNCHFCERSFPRKDTLRRHVEDGCQKRPECKKRSPRVARRASAASSLRRSSVQRSQDALLAPSPLRSLL